MAAISAHSPRTGTIEAFANAVGTGAEYVEFDIRRTADGELAAFHDARTRQGEPLAAISYSRLCEAAGYPVPRVADVMARIAGKATGHLDLKDTGGEEQVVEMALEILGAGNFVVTTLEDRSVAAIKARFPAVPAALSLGRDLDEVPGPGGRRPGSANSSRCAGYGPAGPTGWRYTAAWPRPAWWRSATGPGSRPWSGRSTRTRR
jgi:Glycerophosphoryl diester phosphodiesterase